jgi:hypothetical protein
MEPFDIWLDRGAKLSCIGGLIAQIVFGTLTLRAVSKPEPTQGDNHFALYFTGWMLTTALSALLVFLAFRQRKPKRPDGAPPHNYPVEEQIYIHIPAVATAVIGDQASTRVSFFSAQSVRLTYCKVKFVRGEASFTLENAQPMNIEAFRAAEQNLQRSLTTDEQERIGQNGRGQILHYEGLAVFGHVEKPFWGMIVEHF